MSKKTAIVLRKTWTPTELLHKAIQGKEWATNALMRRMSKLETLTMVMVEVVRAARDLEQNYNIPGPARFQRVVRLRAALDKAEDRLGIKL